MAVRGTELDSWPAHTPSGFMYRVFYTYSDDEVTLLSVKRFRVPETRGF
jgi:hypothetical protein